MTATKITPKYMMATKAIHQLGDLSSEEPDICVVVEETETDFIGNWVLGLGFFGVKFPKETTRDLTPEEMKFYQGKKLAMYGSFSGEKSYDCGSIQIPGGHVQSGDVEITDREFREE